MATVLTRRRGLIPAGVDRPLGLAVLLSTLAGVAVGTGSRPALLVVAAVAAACLFALPVVWLASMAVGASLVYRLVAPTTTGVVSVVPDVLLAVTVLKVAALASVGHLGRPLALARRVAIPLVAFSGIALISGLYHGDPAVSFLASMRQFARYPLFALALSVYGLSWTEGKRLLTVVLGLSLVQLPLAAYQSIHPPANPFRDVVFFPGDNISGTFGIGGSNTEMVFLVLCALVWLSLVLHRQLGGWVLWAIAPALVLPMALGSAAAFLILLPVAVVSLLIRSALAHRSVRLWGALVGAVFLIGTGIFTASSLSIAPGFAGSAPPNASVILQASYLSRYLTETSDPGSHTRLGFLHLAVDTDRRDGWDGLLLGQGPADAVIGPAHVQVGATRTSLLGRSSVQSVPRLVLGFGFLGLGAFVLLVLGPLFGLKRGRPVDGTALALQTMLPVAAAVFLVAGVYNASWSDPGIAATFWALVLAAHAGMSSARSELAEESEQT